MELSFVFPKSIVPSTAESFSSLFLFVSLTFVVVAICDLQFSFFIRCFSSSFAPTSSSRCFSLFGDLFYRRHILIFCNIAPLWKSHTKQRIQFLCMSHSSKLNQKQKKNADERRWKKRCWQNCKMENTQSHDLVKTSMNEYIRGSAKKTHETIRGKTHNQRKNWGKPRFPEKVCRGRSVGNLGRQIAQERLTG